MTVTELLMNCLAGLGLLFVGIKMVTRNLGVVAGDHLRRGIGWATAHRGVANLFGVVAGFITQSGRTTSFILASFVHAGIIDVRRALPMVLWSNFGCTLVIFAAIFPLHLFALFLLAVAGACVAFERPRPLLNAASATFGLALMLFGLKMTSSTATLLTDLHGFSHVLSQISGSLPLCFATGLALTLIAQSHMAVMLIAVALASKGIFGFDQMLMLICGTHAGSGIITYMTGIHFRGVPRQLVIGQIAYNFVGIGLFLIPFSVAKFFDLMPGLAGAFGLSAAVSPGNQAALTAVALNLATPLVLTLARDPYARLCARLSPPQEDEELARPKFLLGDLGTNATVTLMLAEKEQLGLLQRLPQYCEWMRDDAEQKNGATAERYFHAFVQVDNCIERAEIALMPKEMSAEDTEWLLNQQKRQQMLSALHETCHEMLQVTREFGPNVQALRISVVEALDTILLTAVDAMANRDSEELDLVETMTSRQGTTMERIRKKYLTIAAATSDEERGQVLQLTSLFERATWSARNFAQLLREAPDMRATQTDRRDPVPEPRTTTFETALPTAGM